MVLIDVNILLYAFRSDSPDHKAYRNWLESVVNSEEPYGLADAALASFVRIATHPRIFTPPAPLEEALRFAGALRERPNCVPVSPGPRYWEIFARLCKAAGAKGNIVADAAFAALAVETGCEWVTTDRDYSRFPGLKWRHPLSKGKP